MRRVERTPAPPSLNGPESAGGKELVAATTFYNIASNKTKSFPFSAYKAADVRDAMRAMFHRKCAYCETFYAPAMPDDVEHYRPKAAYLERGKQRKPGYWWLAMEWSNLLPSCADCNRHRNQEIVGTDGRKVAGKANQFPLVDGSVRGTAKAGVGSETPLLLDPTVDDPAEHIEFLPNGVVRPRLQGSVQSARGRTTIEVVALLRKDLVHARLTAAVATNAAIEHVVRTIDDIRWVTELPGISKRDRDARLKELRSRLDQNLADLEAKASPDTPYSAVAEALVQSFKAERGL
jgi:uncharacterized protein (TIGR02646 family)